MKDGEIQDWLRPGVNVTFVMSVNNEGVVQTLRWPGVVRFVSGGMVTVSYEYRQEERVRIFPREWLVPG